MSSKTVNCLYQPGLPFAAFVTDSVSTLTDVVQPQGRREVHAHAVCV